MNKTNKPFSFSISPDLLKKAKETASNERRSVSSVINQALDEYFKTRESKRD